MPWSAPCSTLTRFPQAPLPVRKRSLGTEEAKAQAALVGVKTVPKGYRVEVVPAEEETCREEEETMEGVVVTPAERAKRRRSKVGGAECRSTKEEELPGPGEVEEGGPAGDPLAEVIQHKDENVGGKFKKPVQIPKEKVKGKSEVKKKKQALKTIKSKKNGTEDAVKVKKPKKVEVVEAPGSTAAPAAGARARRRRRWRAARSGAGPT